MLDFRSRLPRRLLPVALALGAVAPLLPRPLGAQLSHPAAAPADSAVLAGTLRAQSGAPLAGGRVAFLGVTGASRTGETDARGRFQLAIPAKVPGRVTLAAVGFRPDTLAVAALPAGGRRELAVTLQPIHVVDAVTVVARRERPLLDTEDAATGGALEREELTALPTDGRDPLALAFNIPGVAQATGFFGDAPPLAIDGANSLYAQYTLDGLDDNEGFLGGPRVELPLGGIERLAVSATTYGASLGRSPSGVVDAQSRAGGERWSGELFAYSRPGRDALFGLDFDAAPKQIPAGVDPNGFKRLQLGAGGGGPLVRGKTYGFGAAEYTSEDEARIGSTARTAFIGLERRQTAKLLGRVDHGWSPTETTTLRVAYSRTDRAGEGTGVIVPEADITTRRIGSLTALIHRSALSGGRGANTASLQLGTFRWYFPPTRSDLTRPQVTILAPDSSVEAVVGSTNFVFDETEIQFQLRDVFETAIGARHTLRAGADLVHGSFRLFGASTNPNGAWEVFDDGNIGQRGQFVSIADIPADVRVRSFTIDASPQEVDLTQTVVGAFVEDRVRLSPSLTLLAGVRWDYDDITSRGASSPDLNNVQPRLSFNWYRTPRSVLRGGLGMYAGKFPYAIWSDAVQFGADGNAVVRFEGDTLRYLQGPSAADLRARRDQLPAREIRLPFARGLQQPMSYQASLGWQLQLGADWSLSVDGVWVETRHLPRSLDLNAITTPLTAADTAPRPVAVGDAERPVLPVPGSYRRLTTTETGGRSRYRALFVALRRRLGATWTVDGNWVWSHAQNDTEDINFNAVQANCFGADFRDAVTSAPCTSSEWADGIEDRRHRITLRSVYTVAERLRLSLVGDWQTGQPANRVAGRTAADGSVQLYDLDGSGPIYGEGFVGNVDRFVGVPRNGERLPNFFELSGGAAWLVPFAAGTLELRADVFNALNATEWGNYANGIPGGGSRTQTGRPGDPILLRSPGRPRQLQLSARFAF